MRRRELLTLLLVVALVVPVGVMAVNKLPNGQFYQGYFTPAVLWACGEGFHDVPKPERPKALSDFVDDPTRTHTLNCDAVKNLPHQEPNSFHKTQRWLLIGAALAWKLHGNPSWDALLPLQIFLLVLTVCGAYGLMRLVSRRVIAAPFTWVAMTTPLTLGMLPQIRDFEKAPFLLLATLGIAHGVLGKTLKHRLIAAALAGVAGGFGMGWRPDVLILLPLGIVALMLQPWEGKRELWKGPAIAALFSAAFLIVAAPILSAYHQGGNNGGVVAIEGLSPLFQERLGLKSEHYQQTYLYNDVYTTQLGAAYGRMIQHKPGEYSLQSKMLEDATNSLYSKQTFYLPADTAMRIGAATVESVRLGGEPVDLGWHAPWQGVVDIARRPFGIRPLMPILLFLALTVLGAISLRILALAVVLAGGLIAVTEIQYLERHVFHLGLLLFLIVGGLLEYWLRRKDPELAASRARLKRVGAFVLGAFVLAYVVYFGLAKFQDNRLDTYTSKLNSSPRTAVAGQTSPGRFTLAKDEIARWPGLDKERTTFLRVTLPGCTAQSSTVSLKYAYKNPYYNFNLSAPLERRTPNPSQWYVVTVSNAATHPVAFEATNGCTPKVERVTPTGVPLLLNLEDDGDYGRSHLTANLNRLPSPVRWLIP